jgi:hypothetical protein
VSRKFSAVRHGVGQKFVQDRPRPTHFPNESFWLLAAAQPADAIIYRRMAGRASAIIGSPIRATS